MIKTLTIKDFIIIDELKLEFDKGFNVITGETGAGKSILINAIDLAFGARASKELIKSGAQRAFIELSIELSDSFPVSFFQDFGIDNFGNEIILSREITETGSRSRINGSLVTQDVIKSLREMVIDIHNQHMTYTYIQPKYHINLLDSYGNEEHSKILNEYKVVYSKYTDILKRLDDAKNKSVLSEQQVDFLKFQISEIESAQIDDVEEDVKLQDELNVLVNFEKLKELTYSGYWALYGEDGCIIDTIGKIKSNLSKAVEMDQSLSEYEAEMINVQESLRELSSSLRNYAESLELDEQRLDEIQSRIDVLDKIKRKYGNTLESVLDNYKKLSDEYNSIEFSQEETEKLEKEKADLEASLLEISDRLSSSRKTISKLLCESLTSELEKLDMPKVRFDVSILDCEYNSLGRDNVEFLISTNISEEPKPLAKIASGGEISRVMLAIKTIFAKTDNINTIIFDEIDTGIFRKALSLT